MPLGWRLPDQRDARREGRHSRPGSDKVAPSPICERCPQTPEAGKHNDGLRAKMWNQLKQLLKHSAIYGIGNIAISLLSFLLVPLYTHYLSLAEFGVYSLMVIVYSLMSLVVDLGLSSSVSRYYFDDARAHGSETESVFRKRLLSTATAVTALTSAGLALGSYFAAG